MPGQVAADNPATERGAYYTGLMACARGQGNDDALARILASRMTGAGALPACCGLASPEYAALLEFHFPGHSPLEAPVQAQQRDTGRHAEVADLENLLKCHRAGVSPSELWIAAIVAVACLGSDHLWQDLGLWCRDDLSCLMRRNFPTLAEKNIHDMKWKKFLYKQLCAAEGVYVCRSPSCEVCVDYQDCFGPEE